VPEIASITGHSPFSAEQILPKYLPRDSEMARNAQRKRGLIGPKLEQSLTISPTARLTVALAAARLPVEFE
jgi:hypothetical protein